MTHLLDRRGFLGFSAAVLGSGAARRVWWARRRTGSWREAYRTDGRPGSWWDTDVFRHRSGRYLATTEARYLQRGKSDLSHQRVPAVLRSVPKRLQPWVAESWTKNDENTRFSFKIRKGITFSDGTQLTPEIVAQNYEQYGRGNEKLRIPVHQQLSRGYDHVEVDGDTVTVVLSKPNQQFLVDTTRLNSPSWAPRPSAWTSKKPGAPKTTSAQARSCSSPRYPNQSAVLARRSGYNVSAGAFTRDQGEAYLDEVIREGAARKRAAHRSVDLPSDRRGHRGIQPSDEAQRSRLPAINCCSTVPRWAPRTTPSCAWTTRFTRTRWCVGHWCWHRPGRFDPRRPHPQPSPPPISILNANTRMRSTDDPVHLRPGQGPRPPRASRLASGVRRHPRQGR